MTEHYLLTLKLIQLLPKYMMPNQYYKIDALPLTFSGKLDRVMVTKKIMELKKQMLFD